MRDMTVCQIAVYGSGASVRAVAVFPDRFVLMGCYETKSYFQGQDMNRQSQYKRHYVSKKHYLFVFNSLSC